MSGRSFSHHCSLGILCLQTGGSDGECPSPPDANEVGGQGSFQRSSETILFLFLQTLPALFLNIVLAVSLKY